MSGFDADRDVTSVMTPMVVSCGPEATIGELAKALASSGRHAVFIMDPRQKPVGVVSDFDLLAGEWLGSKGASLDAMRRITAAELMSSPVETIAATATAEDAAHRMCELRIARLLVCHSDGAAAGVVSILDLVRALSSAPTARERVRDVMSHAILTCRPDAPLRSAVRAMTSRHSRSVVVVENDRPVGVLTGRDVLRLYDKRWSGGSDAVVRDLMSEPVITASPDLPLRQAADRMLEHEIHRLVVVDPVDGTGPLGIVSTFDMVEEMAQESSVWQSPPTRSPEFRPQHS